MRRGRNIHGSGGSSLPELSHLVLNDERGAVRVDGPRTVGLVWPNSYATGMGSLGFLWAYASLNVKAQWRCERYFAEPPCVATGRFPVSLESGFPLPHCDLIAVSISFEPDIVNVVRMLEAAKIPALAAERTEGPLRVVAGGPLTRSNPDLLVPFADEVVIGDGEAAVARLTGCEPQGFPIVARLRTPRAAFGDTVLAEITRGCPKRCTFCVGRSENGPLRLADIDELKARIPDDAPGLGLIGAAVSYHPKLKELLAWAGGRKLKVGVSSLRADRLDAETVGLLAKTGCEVLTVAADGGSERLRQEIGKEVTEADLVRCAELARDAGMNALKVYAMVGLPGETEEDIRELALLANRLHRIRPVVLSLAVFVPKRFTPLAGAEFGPVGAVAERLRLLRRGCSGGVRLGRVSAREAAVEHWLSHATAADAEKIIAVARTPARVQDWGRVIGQ